MVSIVTKPGTAACWLRVQILRLLLIAPSPVSAILQSIVEVVGDSISTKRVTMLNPQSQNLAAQIRSPYLVRVSHLLHPPRLPLLSKHPLRPCQLSQKHPIATRIIVLINSSRTPPVLAYFARLTQQVSIPMLQPFHHIWEAA